MFMNKSSKLVCGIGTKGLTYSTTDNSDNMECSRIYQLWLNMLKRCTAKFQTEYPTYVGTTCSENFKSYTFFTEWCYVQAGFTTESVGGCWQLDKDTLIKGNKLYGEDTCVFVPRRVNMLLVKRDAKRGKYPIGVHLDKPTGRFVAQHSGGKGKTKYLGSFSTPQEAFQAYKTFKEALIKEVANEYKYQLDPRVYEALMNYEVNEND